jgi:hypothetical protein
MLVTVAVLVILMTIVVQIFQAATGSVSAAQAYQQLDDQLRRLDGIMRSDLEGVTARFTPPLDPVLNLGYFEYGENEFADTQGEDSDDYIRFTGKAPAGRPFSGRIFLRPILLNGANANLSQSVTITSDYAEIIYFVRNGNLYRRVLLVLPQDLQSAITPALDNLGFLQNGIALPPPPGAGAGFPAGGFSSSVFGTPSPQVSWQGVNDISARPNSTGPNSNLNLPAFVRAQQTIVLNTLGDLTNRENRFAYPRFANDYYDANVAAIGHDGVPDDLNGDNVPDLYTSLYPNVFNTGLIFAPNYPIGAPAIATGIPLLAFPYVFPGAYSQAQNLGNYAIGWIHSPTPAVNNPAMTYGGTPLAYLQNLNHNPLDVGDNLPFPALASEYQTWWGFPTWRETLSPNWNDPTVQVNVIGAQPNGLSYGSLNIAGGAVDPTNAGLLPPMTQPNGAATPGGDFSIFRRTSQLFSDAAGFNSVFWTAANPSNVPLWTASWDDDLIMTGVRSFDVKAYDNALAQWADLGWGDDLRSSGFAGLPFLTGNPDHSPGATAAPPNPVYPPLVAIQNNYWDYINQTFAHEGRMPPLTSDNRLDAQNPNPAYRYNAATTANPPGYIPQYGGFPNYSSNIGDNAAGIVRLRRVWDTWSTAYSRAPATGLINAGGSTGFPVGPPFSPPLYPSYPPPYPAPLRGIQIQIRVVDPTNQRIKSLTIRQDFTDKL